MTQSTVNLPSGEYLIFEWANNAKEAEVLNGALFFFFDTQIKNAKRYQLPPGNWTLLGADPTRLTEEEAEEIFTYSAWLIEDLTNTTWASYGVLNKPSYNEIGWTSDAFKAIMFKSKKEALNCLMKYIRYDNITVTEHLFYNFNFGEAKDKLSSLAKSKGIAEPYVILKKK